MLEMRVAAHDVPARQRRNDPCELLLDFGFRSQKPSRTADLGERNMKLRILDPKRACVGNVCVDFSYLVFQKGDFGAGTAECRKGCNLARYRASPIRKVAQLLLGKGLASRNRSDAILDLGSDVGPTISAPPSFDVALVAQNGQSLAGGHCRNTESIREVGFTRQPIPGPKQTRPQSLSKTPNDLFRGAAIGNRQP